jgi:hypothetical protein
VSAKGFLARCGTARRFLLFESPVSGGWTSVRNSLWANFQYISIYSELNLSSSLASDDNVLIKPSGLLTFIFNYFLRIVIYLFIHSLLTLIIYVFHYLLRKCVRRTKSTQTCFHLFDKEVFNASSNTPDGYNNISLPAHDTDSCLLSFSWITSMSKTHVF